MCLSQARKKYHQFHPIYAFAAGRIGGTVTNVFHLEFKINHTLYCQYVSIALLTLLR